MAGFFVTLPSTASLSFHTDNRPDHFTVRLPNPLDLKGRWEVALTSYTGPSSWITINETTEFYILLHENYVMSASGAPNPLYLNRVHKELVPDEEETNRIIPAAVPRSALLPGTGLAEKEYTKSKPNLFCSGTVIDSGEKVLQSEAITSPVRIFRLNIKIPPSNFPDVESICRYLEDLVYKKFFRQRPYLRGSLDGVIYFEFNKQSKKVSFKYNKFFGKVGIYPVAGRLLWDILGWMDSKSRLSDEILHFRVPKQIAQIGHLFPALYLYCDFIEFQVVGDVKAPLLRAIPITRIGKDLVHNETFTLPFYLPVAKNYINSITIAICSDSGEPIKFEGDKVILVLHFRPKNGNA